MTNRDGPCRASVRQRQRRRATSQRLVPLDCGCPQGRHSDPISCLCTNPPLSTAALDGWRDAAEHVLSAGQIPLLPLEVRRSLWRRGGRDREIAELLHDACGGVVA